MSGISTKEWVQFFSDAGIPTQASTSYALTFSENRIQKNMLLDLNKEYLRDMGITLMGDVIAILKQAKTTHEQFIREKMLGNVPDEPKSGKQVILESSDKSAAMKRILSHYTRKYESSDSNSNEEVVEITINNQSKVQEKELVPKLSLQTKSLKRKIVPESNTTSHKDSQVQPPVRNIINLKAKKIKKTVFDRLGESSVSSTSEKDLSVTAKLNKTPTPELSKPSNVFARLGDKANSVPLVSSSTVDDDEIETLQNEPLQYAGILKTPPMKKNKPSTTMRADTVPHIAKITPKPLLKARLGVTPTAQTTIIPNLKRSSQSAHDDVPTSKKFKKLNITATLQNDDDIMISKNSSLSSRFKSSKHIIVSESGFKAVNKKSSGAFENFVINPKVNIKPGKIFQSEATSSSSNKVQRPVHDATKLGRISSTSEDYDLTQKKVRFGKTTHRLIPGNKEQPQNAIKKFPKLTMQISNSTKLPSRLSSGVMVGQLNSDNVKKKSIIDRIGVKPSNKLAQGRLSLPTQRVVAKTSVKSRLGLK